MKQIGLSIVAVSILSTSNYATGIPVVDVAHIAETAAGWAAEAKRWIDTVKNYKSELLAKTGIRDIISFQQEMQQLMDFMDNYSLDFMDLTNDIVDNPRSQIGQYAKRLFEQYNLFDDCAYDYMSNDQKRICKSEMVRNVQEIATYQHTTQKIKRIMENLKSLSNKRIDSEDVKQSADIGNAIQMQLAQLEIIKTQIGMMESQNRSKERVDHKQLMQLSKQRQNKSRK